MKVEEINKQLVREFFGALNRGDVSAIVAAYAPDGRVETMGRTLISGRFSREQISAAAGQIYAAFPRGLTFTIDAVTAEGDLLITTGDAMGGGGMRRIAVAHGPAGWSAEERWTSMGLKPSFNDSVIHKRHAYGFDGSILACIDLQDGKRIWKGGRYGNGQLVLLADQDLLLVTSEEGELALVAATPDQFHELARFPGIEGKTWNHPVLVGDVLLVRNGEEMAAFRLSLAGG